MFPRYRLFSSSETRINPRTLALNKGTLYVMWQHKPSRHMSAARSTGRQHFAFTAYKLMTVTPLCPLRPLPSHPHVIYTPASEGDCRVTPARHTAPQTPPEIFPWSHLSPSARPPMHPTRLPHVKGGIFHLMCLSLPSWAERHWNWAHNLLNGSRTPFFSSAAVLKNPKRRFGGGAIHDALKIGWHDFPVSSILIFNDNKQEWIPYVDDRFLNEGVWLITFAKDVTRRQLRHGVSVTVGVPRRLSRWDYMLSKERFKRLGACVPCKSHGFVWRSMDLSQSDRDGAKRR